MESGNGQNSAQPSPATVSTKIKAFNRPIVVSGEESGPKIRHSKGVRPRGCPCCDPDNMENIVDKLLFLNAPP